MTETTTDLERVLKGIRERMLTLRGQFNEAEAARIKAEQTSGQISDDLDALTSAESRIVAAIGALKQGRKS